MVDTQNMIDVSAEPWYIERIGISRYWSTLGDDRKSGAIQVYDTIFDCTHHAFETILGDCGRRQLLLDRRDPNNFHGTVVASVISAKRGLYYNTNYNGYGILPVVVPEAELRGNERQRILYRRNTILITGVAPGTPLYVKRSLHLQSQELFVRTHIDNMVRDLGLRVDRARTSLFSFSYSISRAEAMNFCQAISNENILAVVALGNSQRHIDQDGLYLFSGYQPDASCLEHLVKVGGTAFYAHNDNMVRPLNDIDYDRDVPDIMAPAVKIRTAVPSPYAEDMKKENGENENKYAGIHQGTSEAAPIVAAALGYMQRCQNNGNVARMRASLAHVEAEHEVVRVQNNDAPVLNFRDAVTYYCTLDVQARPEIPHDEM